MVIFREHAVLQLPRGALCDIVNMFIHFRRGAFRGYERCLCMQKRFSCLLLAVLLFIYSALPAGAVSPGDTSPSDAPPALSQSDSTSAGDAQPPAESSPSEEDNDVMETTASMIASEINLGWNLGESLDSWSETAGYDDYHNANSYEMILRYDDAEDVRATSIRTTFDKNNRCTYKWATGLIDSDTKTKVGSIGFEIWNKALEEDTTITVKVTKAQLTRRSGIAYDVKGLLGEHTITISKYGTAAVLTDKFPSGVKKTYNVIDGTFEVTVELVDFPQKEYNKSAYFETLSNNPITTYEMIEKVHDTGFNAVRIPVTFINHTVSGTNVIDSGWLDRIAEVVEYAYYQDMYVILCMYNDGDSAGWLRVNTSDSDAVRSKYASLWTQIAERFRDYDQRVLFQGFNELTDKDETWDYPGEEDIGWLNDLNQLFVDTVRATGGRNGYRTLVLSPYAGSHEQEIIDGFRLPDDTVNDRLLVSVNAYAPALFSYSINTEETSFTDIHEWGSEADKAELDTIFDRLHNRFTAKGIPVMIGEFCTADKGNTEHRVRHAAYYTSAAAQRGIPCFWWDDGGLLMRKVSAWSVPELVDAMVDSTSVHLRHVGIAGLGEQYHTGQPVIPDLKLVWSPNGVDAALVSAADAGLVGVPPVSGADTPPVDPDAVILTRGVDYEMICFNNVEKGTAEVTITGLGRYSGVRHEKFTIVEKPKEVDLISVLAGDNPQLPFVIMVSVPILLTLTFLSVWKAVRRRERERVRLTVQNALAEEMEARGQAAYGPQAIYKGDRSYDNNRAMQDYVANGEYDDFDDL